MLTALDDLEDLIRRHRQSRILVDANLLMTLLLAQWNPDAALRFKRLQAYTEDDLELLKLVVGHFNRCLVTPSVLAEVSNLTGRLREPLRSELFSFLHHIFRTALFDERCVPLKEVVDASCFVRLGFTDATVEQLGRAGVPVLTDDLPLYAHLLEQGIEAFNITHFRFLAE